MRTKIGRTPRWKLAAVAVAAAMVATACGGNSGEGAGSDSSSASEIGVGLLISLTGGSASSDSSGAGVAQAWEKAVNADGGINGNPVKVHVVDDKGDPAASLSAAKSLVGNKKVLWLASASSNTETAVSQYLKTQDIAVVGAVGYSTKIWGALPNYISTQVPGPTLVMAQHATAKLVGAHNWASAYCAEVAQCKASVPLHEPAAKQFGLTYKGSLSVSTTAPSYTAECLKFLQMGTDFLQIAFAPAGARRLVKDCNAQGYKGWFGASGGTVNSQVTSIEDARLAGGLHGFPWWAEAAPVKEYRDAMAKYSPDTNYAAPSSTAVWAALQLARKALTTSGAKTPTREDVFTGLYGLRDESLDGLLPQKMTYTKGKPAPFVTCYWPYERVDGTFKSVPIQGVSGNGVSGDLATQCVTLPKLG